MNVRLKLLVAIGAAALVTMPVTAVAQHYRAKADGYQVVSSQNTPGSATFDATVDRKAQTITYTLKFENLRGTITQSHIHFNRPGFNGGIILFLCVNGTLNAKAPTAATPQCDGTEATVGPEVQEGKADVTFRPFGNAFPPDPQTGSTQGFTKGDFDSLVKALDAGATYIVVHTTAVPSGELRGQIARVEREKENEKEADER